MKNKFLLAAGVASVLTAFAGEAAAQNNGEYPVRLVLRPQTIPARTIRLDGDIGITGVSICARSLLGSVCASSTITGLNLGGAFGVTHDFEVGALVAPLAFSPNFAYGYPSYTGYVNPSVYGRFQFLHNGTMQIAGHAQVFIPAADGSKLAFTLGVPFWYGFSEVFQLRTGLFYNGTLTDPDYSHSLNVPLNFNLNLTDNLHLALLTGVGFGLQAPGDTFTVPLGIEGGFAIAGANNRPMLDLLASFSFPGFLVPGSSGDVVNTNVWAANLGARFYLFM